MVSVCLLVFFLHFSRMPIEFHVVCSWSSGVLKCGTYMKSAHEATKRRHQSHAAQAPLSSQPDHYSVLTSGPVPSLTDTLLHDLRLNAQHHPISASAAGWSYPYPPPSPLLIVPGSRRSYRNSGQPTSARTSQSYPHIAYRRYGHCIGACCAMRRLIRYVPLLTVHVST